METADNQQVKRRPLMRRDKAAGYLRDALGLPYTKNRLAKDAVNGTGPAFQYFGKIPLYDPDDLDRHAEEGLSPKMRSTSGLPPRDKCPGKPRTAPRRP
jgi:hypothetical protein